MKFLAFVDLHADLMDFLTIKEKIEEEKPDFLICAGDFTIFGNQTKEMLNLMNDVGIKIYLIHGNHESRKEVEKECEKLKHIEFVHKQIKIINNTHFVFFGGGGFSEREPQFETFVKKNKETLKSAQNVILITHAPPKDTAVDEVQEDYHVGVMDFKEFITQYQPLLSVSGHIHDTYKKQEKIGETLVINPGWDGEVFEF